MPEFGQITWTDFANGVWLIILALITGVGSIFGYRRINHPPPPSTVQATLVDEKLLERMTAAFEAMVRLQSSVGEILKNNSEIIVDNTEQLKVNTKMLRDILEQSERLARDVRELTFELERNRK